MKLFRNLLVATTAVVVMSAASVFAEDAFNVTYDNTDSANKASVVALEGSTLDALTAKYGDQVTVVVVPIGTTEVSDANIYYINQDAQSAAPTMLTNMGLKDLNSEVTDYEVWIGGSNGTIDKVKFSTATTPTGEKVQIGDTTLDGTVNGSDINPIIQHILGATPLKEKAFIAGDTTQDNTVNGSDINPVIQHILGAVTLGKATYTPAK